MSIFHFGAKQTKLFPSEADPGNNLVFGPTPEILNDLVSDFDETRRVPNSHRFGNAATDVYFWEEISNVYTGNSASSTAKYFVNLPAETPLVSVQGTNGGFSNGTSIRTIVYEKSFFANPGDVPSFDWGSAKSDNGGDYSSLDITFGTDIVIDNFDEPILFNGIQELPEAFGVESTINKVDFQIRSGAARIGGFDLDVSIESHASISNIYIFRLSHFSESRDNDEQMSSAIKLSGPKINGVLVPTI